MLTQWFGNEITDTSNVDSYDDRYWLDTQMTAPSDGRVTPFRIFAKRTSPVQLVLYRKWGQSFAVVGKSPVFTPSALGKNEFALSSPLPVRAGDMIGFYTPKDGAIAFPAADADIRAGKDGRVVLTPRGGHEVQFTETSNRRYMLQIGIEVGKSAAGHETNAPSIGDEHGELRSAIDRVRHGDGALAGILRYSELILSDSPLAYYRLNERNGTVAHDVSGNNRHGTYRGGVRLSDAGAFAEGDAASKVTSLSGAGPFFARVEGPTGHSEVDAEIVVDATGRASKIARSLGGERVAYDRLVGILGVLEPPAGRAPAAKALVLEAAPEGWLYSVPLPGGSLLAVAMVDADTIPRSGVRPIELWQRMIERSDHTRSRVAGLCAPESVVVRKASTERLSRILGPAFIAVGDAATSYDPLSSQGICKALMSGELAAQAIAARLDGDGEAFNQ